MVRPAAAWDGAARREWGVAMPEVKQTWQWAEQTMRTLSEQGFTGTVTIRLAQGGVQSLSVSQELHPKQELPSGAQGRQMKPPQKA